ncbi:CAMK family protein kinase [Trichomonas vaginalis G3]|uniref:CAMK family protein kinase n=1 Tax=Trichomonas vaginalis (strain ATCC PRA-98 / G3) TaxID=412133 RepID=A2FZE1_TRIV3|nr:protein serine/threonine kinase protein [Trichomonas vaginalis G3]EAX89733.1 CAMK family protein kinase [Trichomonas vaginalis G3]KAI5510783.1 protein serine/threonine kinase protein [Trichomonas vaginalis G3]|eukprot:XP_001302663.1 CAMK family protein kinase [Trichomonas vaginalis G3]
MISVTNNLDESPVNTSRIRIPSHIGKYTITKLIGKGGFAVVVLAVNDQTHQQVAIKICDRVQIQENNILAYLEAELRLSMRFNHPNIAKTYEVIYEPDIILIVMEYFPNGDLQSLLTHGVKFTTQEQIKIAIGVLNGLNYLHQRGISHRDIKPENIVFDEKLNPKIIDFGLSKEDSSNLYTFCGTPYYVAPEMITSHSYNGMKADIWAFGITLHCLATGSNE